MKQETKIHGDQNANEFELCFETTNQETTAGGVYGQDKAANRRNGDHVEDL